MTKNVDKAMEILMKIQTHYAMKGLNLSAADAYETKGNVTILDLVAGELQLSESCCMDVRSFIARGCICDQGSFGKLLNITWNNIEKHWKHLMVSIAQEQCKIYVPPDYDKRAISDLDNSDQCKCRKVLADLERLSKQERMSKQRKKKPMPMVDLSQLNQPLEFRDFRQARQFFAERRLEQLNLNNETTTGVLDICS